MEKAYELKRRLLILFLIGGFSVILSAQAFGQVKKISVKKMLASLDNPRFLILDVRTTESWQASDTKIKGAVRKNPKTFDSWANDLPKNKFLVLY